MLTIILTLGGFALLVSISNQINPKNKRFIQFSILIFMTSLIIYQENAGPIFEKNPRSTDLLILENKF